MWVQLVHLTILQWGKKGWVGFEDDEILGQLITRQVKNEI